MSAPEVLIPAASGSFTGSYIFVSNLNNGQTQDPRGDAITVLIRGDNGNLTVSGYVFTKLQKIRAMRYFGDDDRYLIAAGQVGDAGVQVYERTGDGGGLKLLAQNKDVATRTSFAWVE